MTVRVFLCDDVSEYRFLLRLSLEEDPSIRVVGESADGLDGVRLIAETSPDVVLLDLSMPGLDGLEALPLIRDRAPGAQIIVHSGFQAYAMAATAIDLGAAAYVEKGEPLERVRAAVLEAAILPA